MALSKEKLEALKNEIIMAKKFNEEEIEPLINENLSRYTGEYVPRMGRSWDIALNEIYPIIQYQLPATFFKNPRAFLKPRQKTYISKQRDPVSGEMVEIQMDSGESAKTQEAILNYLITEINYKKHARRVLLDALLFPYGVLWHGYKGNFGMTEELSLEIKDEKIFVTRVAPLRFIHDPSVSIANLDEGRWVGRIIDIPLEDLLDDDKLNVQKKFIKGIRGFGDKVGGKVIDTGGKDIVRTTSSSTPKPLIDFADEQFKNSRAARFVRLYEIYLRATKKEEREGKRGTVLLLTDEQPEPLRESPWTIKAEGFPAQVLEFNELPDSMFGLDDISTYKHIADQKNAIVNLQLRNAQELTKTWVGISKEAIEGEEQIEKIQKGENTIILFESGNPKDRMYVANAGTPSTELYIIDQRIQQNLEDKSSVTDLKRGFLKSGEESAASVKLRNAGGAVRPAYRQDIMAEFLKRSFLYLNHLNKQFLTIKDAVRIIGSLDLQWSPNPSKEELQADVDVEIDVISMLPEDPQREMQQYQTILTLAIEALARPEVFQKLQQEGKTFNISPLIEQILLRMRIRDPEIFRSIRPEESQGFVSVQQIREAGENVTAAVTGQPIPYPPRMEDDHRAKLETYGKINQILQMAGQVSDALNQLIQIHTALLQEIMEKEARPGQKLQPIKRLKAPSVQGV